MNFKVGICLCLCIYYTHYIWPDVFPFNSFQLSSLSLHILPYYLGYNMAKYNVLKKFKTGDIMGCLVLDIALWLLYQNFEIFETGKLLQKLIYPVINVLGIITSLKICKFIIEKNREIK